MWEAYGVLALFAAIGVWAASAFGGMILGFIPASIGGGATPNKYVALFVNGAIVAAVIVLGGHLHGRIGSDLRRGEK